ncbi:integrase core domain-containing protein [Laribacter hongkongensis]|uniref:integrase core domain-containing protein n=1 Tax=Laribacter hongkongensis TaxID=168471 RepID=UPI002832CB2A|nr:integrase core domain-containing protein [Laribacter hongkongensis]
MGDNRSVCTTRATRKFAREPELAPVTAPVRSSSQSNGMTGSLAKTIKRDYVSHMPKPDAATALRNLGIAFVHYSKHHPHSALNCRSLRRVSPPSDHLNLTRAEYPEIRRQI